MSQPVASVAVSSRNRPLRLRWLLNALDEQTFSHESFEVVVAHDSSDAETEQLLRTHRLVASGQLRQISFPALSMLAGAKRNAAWQAARAPLVLFTDDDCRPAADWVERAVAAAARHPGAVVQGKTIPDPDESATLHGAPWIHSVAIDPPSAWGETCNIAYPRQVLERVGDFDEGMESGEDTDLALRAQEAGTQLVGAPEMLVYHAVEERFLLGAMRARGRWGDMALVAKRHPQTRRHMWGMLWWRREQAAFTAAAIGLGIARRHRPAIALALPWIALSMRHRGYSPRGIVRSLTELPGRAALDAAEFAALARGSIRYRTLLL